MNKNVVIGIDIGGTNTKVGIFSQEGELIDSLHFPTQKDSPSPFFEFIHQQTLDCFSKHKIDPAHIIGIGIGAPMANAHTGAISYAHNLGWRDVQIQKEFFTLFKCPVYLDNDANLAAIGESYFGAGKNTHSFILLTLGTGVGTGVVINNKIIRGYNGLGGEGGHIVIDSPQQRVCPCGGVNHVEAYLGAQGIKQTFQENELNIHIKEFASYLEKKDAKALLCLELICEQLSTAIVNMSVVLGPEKIILAGGVSQIGEVFLKKLEDKVNEKIFYSLKNQMTFHLATVSTKKGAIYGGAALVMAEVL